MSLRSPTLRNGAATLLALTAAAILSAPALAQQPAPIDLTYTHAAPPTAMVDQPGASAERRRRSSGNPIEISEGAALLAKAGVTCRHSDGRLISSNGREAVYELACEDNFGWFVARDAKGDITALDCLAAATQSKGASHCLLPTNRTQLRGMQALADRAKATCKVTDGVWIGAGGNPPIVRYEATCAEGGGYILDTPKPGTTSDLIATACKDAPPLGLKCKLIKPG